MDMTVFPGTLSGNLSIIPSKSHAHRLLICAALADKPIFLRCPATSRDLEATARCLNALGAEIQTTGEGYYVNPITTPPETARLYCGESGSTLRFLLPLVGALGMDGTFHMEGRLPQRPLSPLWERMEEHGCHLTRPTADTLRCQGQLTGGTYTVPGNVSSQYISGLLFALPRLPGGGEIEIAGNLESAPYVTMTREALSLFGVQTEGFSVPGGQIYRSPGDMDVEGDWSNGAFFLTANNLGSHVEVLGLNPSSSQGDRQIVDCLARLSEFTQIDVSNIPDLVPILAVAAAMHHGAEFTHVARLRLKESDRVESVCAMINALGGQADSTADTLTVHPVPLTGGTVDSVGDHRIAMAAAIAATVCRDPVTILGAQSVEKSYPSFWAEFARLGGRYEQHLR